MSDHYDLVIVCDLLEAAPLACIEMIEWLTNPASDPATKPDFDCLSGNDAALNGNFHFSFLAPLASEQIISLFQNRYRYTMSAVEGGANVYGYTLQFSGRNILDDGFYDCYLLFLYWLASISEDGFVGYYIEEFDARPTLLYVKDQKLEERP
ncbi:MAG: hypothetical protein ABI700_29690 [Chloroflexota bacterium]